MAIGKYIPSMDQTIRVAVAIVIIFLILKYLPIPASIKELFRV